MALVPYTDPNLKLTYSPNRFFNDLERISNSSKRNTKNTFYRAIENGYVDLDNQNSPSLTEAGIRKLAPYRSKKLKNAKLMVIFDIPETKRHLRDSLRLLLKEFKFEPVQKSVWVTNLDCKKYVKQDIKNMQLENYIKIYESVEI